MMEFKKMTREELNRSLERLGKTSAEKDPRRFAMCYSRMPARYEDEHCVCDGCGRDFILPDVETYSKKITDQYRELAGRFVRLGYKAKVRFYCDDCIEKAKDKLAPIVFLFYAGNDKEPVISYPSCYGYNDEKYRYALEFLAGRDSADALNERFDSCQNGDYYAEAIRSIIGPLAEPNVPPKQQKPNAMLWNMMFDEL